ncbi:MAG: GTPase Era [Pseudomonadota bacterium]
MNDQMDETMPAATDDEASMRSGFVALIGAPNAGKSTLLNRLVGAKVSIVTHKVQTTRSIIRGILTKGRSQIVFLDTPGIFKPRRRLDRAMVTSAWGGAREADVVALLIDVGRGLTGDAERIVEQLSGFKGRIVLLLNKVDTIPAEKLLALSAEINEKVDFEATFMLSALKGSGCDDFAEWLEAEMPLGHWFYPEDQLSDLPMRQLAAELTREKLYLRLHQELPYSAHVETESWEEQKDGSVKVSQVIYIQRDAHKRIVIGKGGQTLKAISMAAREELAEILEQKVHLFIFVKVRENWGDDPERYADLGLEFPGS